MIKYARFQIASTIGAAATLGETAVVTTDDSAPRKVTGIRPTDTTKLIRTVLMKSGQPIADLDDGLFAQYLDFVPLDVQYPSGQQITLDVRNNSGGALNANTNAVVIRYEI